MNIGDSTSIQIGRVRVGQPGYVYVIAEAVVNHDGRLDRAIRLIAAAAEVGADAVKFQCFSADRLVTRTSPLAAYQQRTGRPRTQYEMLQRLELDREAWYALAREAKRCSIDFLATPFSVQDLEFLVSLGVTAIKLASTDIVHGPLLDVAARAGRPIIASTGAATMEEVARGVERLRAGGAKALALLHCISSYPTSERSVNLAAICTLARTFGCVSGFSDHTQSSEMGRWAALAGARVIEKHLTLDRAGEGPDHGFSLEPATMKMYVRGVRQACQLLGDGHLRVSAEQEEVRRMARSSLVAERDIPAGWVLTPGMLAVKRPGNGISPMEIERVIGCRARWLIPADTPITWNALGPPGSQSELPE